MIEYSNTIANPYTMMISIRYASNINYSNQNLPFTSSTMLTKWYSYNFAF